MSSLDEQIDQLESAMAAQETLRSSLGDAMVDVTLRALQAQLQELRAKKNSGPLKERRATGDVTTEALLARLQNYLPKELAAKMRAMGRIEAERKVVTVLFADISGFTALSERIDPEQVTALTNEALKELAEAVYQYEGYIDKFIGDSIMAVFGAPIVHEDDPERALRAALAMRERLENFNRRWVTRMDQPLQLHIGVNTGPVIAGNVGPDLRLSYTVMGDTVNTASRMESAALPGKIYVSRDTYRITNEAFTFDELDPITVKGKRGQLAVYELKRARLLPGKSRGLKNLASAFVGRDRELEQLREVMLDLEHGRGRIVSINGEAGIGKSRLLAEWQSEVGERALWLEGRAFNHTASLAYAPFLDLLRRFAGIRDDDSEVDARIRLDAKMEGQFPGNTEARAILAHLLAMRLSETESALLAAMPGDVFRRHLFSVISELFQRLAGERPTILIIEDIHWADLTSIDLIESLLPLVRRVPLAIIGVRRLHPEEQPSKLRSHVEANYADVFTDISLSPLSEIASLNMIERLLSTSAVPESLCALIIRKAEGNPFFVEEVIRALIERGAMVRANGSEWKATPLIETIAVPDTLQGVLMARIDSLPDETRWVVQQASVIGRIFLYRVLLHIAENSTGLEADLSHLEREELIRERMRLPELEYIFKHGLTQEVAYQSLLAPRRKELHRKVGQALEAIFAERLGEFYSIIGQHFLHGEAWEQATEYLIKAGDAALRLYAYPEARLNYADALAALPHAPDSDNNRRCRVDTMTKQVSVSFGADSPEQNLARLAEAEAIAKALPTSEDTRDADRLRLARIHYWMGRSHYYRAEAREAIGYFKQVLAVAQEFGDEELLGIPSSLTGQALLSQGQFGKAGPLLEQSIAPLERAANWPEWIRAVAFYGFSLAGRGHYAQGLAQGRRALARATETKFLTGVGTSHLMLWLIHFMGGNVQSMLAESQDTLEVSKQSGDRLYIYFSLGFRGWAESRLGNHEAAMQTMAEAKMVEKSIGGRLILSDWFAAADAEIALSAGRTESVPGLAQTAIAAAQLGGNLLPQGLAHRTWGLAAAALETPNWEEAEEHLVSSMQALETGEAVLEAARTHMAFGQVYRDWGKVTKSREHWEKAARQFEISALPLELERARNMLDTL